MSHCTLNRFNRVFDCCANILYHLDNIRLYLDTYSNILNGIAILDRRFLDMEMLEPIFCSAALVGIHFTRPFLSLLIDTTTNFDTLANAFPIFHNDLVNMSTEKMLQTDKRVLNSNQRFKSSLCPKNVYVIQLIGVLLRKRKE